MLIWNSWSKLAVGDRFEQRGMIDRFILSIGPLITSLRCNGARTTLAKLARYPFRRSYKHQTAQIFSTIYKDKLWGDQESVSGAGSTLEYTLHLREQLPRLFEEFSIKSVYDAPCGDFNWMRRVVEKTEITYLGADIVPAIISALQKRHGNSRLRFEVADITRDKFPGADLWICRDCLFHLSNGDIARALRNFLTSGTPLFLTTTHINTGEFDNVDIQTGGFRRIDLFSPPYFFSRDTLAQIPDWIAPWPPREMRLWTRDQVASAVKQMEQSMSPFLVDQRRTQYNH